MESSPIWLREICQRLESGDDTLTNLNLNIRKLNLAMMEELARAMQNSSRLVILNLTSSFTSDPSVLGPLVCRVLPKVNVSLEVLYLSYNRIQDTRELGTALVTNKSLTELYLNYNVIDANGAHYIAQGLRGNTNLLVLQMHCNCIGDEGAYALAQGLAANKSLQCICLSNNGITDRGGAALELVVSGPNEKLEQCRLGGNLISFVCMGRIDIACHANRAGRWLLTDNHATSDTMTITAKLKILSRVLARAGCRKILGGNVVYFLLRNHLCFYF